jgi:hypothetical protein
MTKSFAANDDGADQAGVAYPNPRFTDNSDETITDNATGLIWTKNADPFPYLTYATQLSDIAALADGTSLAKPGYTGSHILKDGSKPGQWRMPSRSELLSIFDFGDGTDYPKTGVATNDSYFAGLRPVPAPNPFARVRAEMYETSTPYAPNKGYFFVLGIDMYITGSPGMGNWSDVASGQNLVVWPVRDGAAKATAPVKIPKTGAGARPGEVGVQWPVPRFTDRKNGTVKDNLTGLVWLKNAGAFKEMNWADGLTTCAALANGQAGLTDGSKAGQWRMPNVRELLSLTTVDFATAPAIPNTDGSGQWSEGDPFSSVKYGAKVDSSYWTSTVSTQNKNQAWVLDTNDGTVNQWGGRLAA